MAHELEVWLFERRVGSLSLVHGRLSLPMRQTGWCCRRRLCRSRCPCRLSPLAIIRLGHSLPVCYPRADAPLDCPAVSGVWSERFRFAGPYWRRMRGGRDLSGAGQALPQTNGTGATGAAGDVEWLSDEKLLTLLDELPRRPMLAGDDGLRLSLAGHRTSCPWFSTVSALACRAMARPARIS